ncbi:unnamed protein product, partial [Rotaria socialis]
SHASSSFLFFFYTSINTSNIASHSTNITLHVPKRPQYPNAEDRITTSNTKPLSHNQRFGTVTITSAV